MSKASWLHLHPHLGNGTLSKQLLAELVRSLPMPDPIALVDNEADIERYRRRVVRERKTWPRQTTSALLASVNVIADLAKQGWRFKVDDTDIYGQPPPVLDIEKERERRRMQLAARRNEQLREESTRRFIVSMEHVRPALKRRESVFSVMRDGRDLAARISKLTSSSTDTQLTAAVEPFVQFVDKDAVCSETGIPLGEIWRYFRHTWANPYESVPGRSMMLLVRDRAVKGHPVMGIAALSSAAVKLRARDEYLGWEGEPFLAALEKAPSERVAKWLLATVERSLTEIHKTDLVRDGVLPRATFGRKGVSKNTIDALLKDSAKARETHHRLADAGEYKKSTPTPESPNKFWKEQAETPLLGKLGLDEEELLHHGLQKSMYGVKLVSNARDYLLGIDAEPEYLFDRKQSASATAAIGLHWARRWMLPRLERPELLDQLRVHTLVHPITHGARVILPDEDIEQGSVF